MDINGVIESLEECGLDVSRIKSYEETDNESILNLRYKDFGHWVPRDRVINNIKKRYQGKESESRVIEIYNQEGTGLYDLNAIARERCIKVFFELYLKIPEKYNINDHMISFSLMIGHRAFVSITNLGSKIFCTSHRNILCNKKDKCVYFPIYLFECLEKGFLDILDTGDHNIYLVLDYIKRNSNTLDLILDEIGLYCLAVDYPEDIQVQRNFIEYCLIERNSFYSTEYRENEWIKVMSKSHNEVIQMPGAYKVNGNEVVIETNEKWLCPVMYVSYLWSSPTSGWPNVQRMDVHIDNFTLDFASSRIITDNNNNFHTIWFFPDSDDDFIKEARVFGINLSMTRGVRINARLTGNNVDDTRVCLGILSFNVLVYYQGDCKLVYK